MVVQKTINNLKKGPKEDKVVVAGGIAISVVVILLVAWAIFFLRSVQRNSQQLNLSGGAQDQFNFSSVREAQQQLQQGYNNSNSDLLDARAAAASGQSGAVQQTEPQQTQGSGTDQFGAPGTTY